MSEGKAELLKIVVRQLGEGHPIDIIRREHCCVLTEAKFIEPLSKAVHSWHLILLSSSPSMADTFVDWRCQRGNLLFHENQRLVSWLRGALAHNWMRRQSL
jgi:hypothetical protein